MNRGFFVRYNTQMPMTPRWLIPLEDGQVLQEGEKVFQARVCKYRDWTPAFSQRLGPYRTYNEAMEAWRGAMRQRGMGYTITHTQICQEPVFGNDYHSPQ